MTYQCESEAIVEVRGGLKLGEPVGGWGGGYCGEHAVACVRLQLFQVPQGMPITIRSINA